MQDRSLLKSLVAVVAVTLLILLLPLIAMQFTSEVRWGPEDFLVAGCLLLGAGTGIVVVRRHVKRTAPRVALIAILVLALVVVWAELAVGILPNHGT